MPVMKTMKEAAAESGISYGTIRRWCISGQFKGFVKAGNKYLINMDRFRDFLNGGVHNE
ncbi:MAG: helix-turn-helix domain-containing protein [Butyrivibrio sp.]